MLMRTRRVHPEKKRYSNDLYTSDKSSDLIGRCDDANNVRGYVILQVYIDPSPLTLAELATPWRGLKDAARTASSNLKMTYTHNVPANL